MATSVSKSEDLPNQRPADTDSKKKCKHPYTTERGHFLFLNRKIVNPAKKKRKNKLFAVSGVLVEFRTQGNGRFASPNWNFQFQFFSPETKCS